MIIQLDVQLIKTNLIGWNYLKSTPGHKMEKMQIYTEKVGILALLTLWTPQQCFYAQGLRIYTYYDSMHSLLSLFMKMCALG